MCYELTDAANHSNAINDAITGYFSLTAISEDGVPSNTVEFSIVIRDDAPVGVRDYAMLWISDSTSISGYVLENDMGGADGIQEIRWTKTDANYGEFTGNSDGTWSYTLSSGVSAIGETETFDYTIIDKDGDEVSLDSGWEPLDLIISIGE